MRKMLIEIQSKVWKNPMLSKLSIYNHVIDRQQHCRGDQQTFIIKIKKTPMPDIAKQINWEM